MIHPENQLPDVLPDYSEQPQRFDTWEIEVHASDRPMELIALMIQMSEEAASAFGPSREFMGVGFSVEEDVEFRDIPAGVGVAKADKAATTLLQRFNRSIDRAIASVSRRSLRWAELNSAYVETAMGQEPNTPPRTAASALVQSFTAYAYRARERAVPKIYKAVEEWLSTDTPLARLQELLEPVAKYMRSQIQTVIRSEMQRGYALLAQEAGGGLDARIERVAQPTACAKCKALAGVHSAGRPDLFWTHPNCSCTWRRSGGGRVATFNIAKVDGKYVLFGANEEPVGEHNSMQEAEAHRDAIAQPYRDEGGDAYFKWTAEAREELEEKDFGDPEGRKFPIKDQSDLDDAARLIGRASNPDRVRARLISIAKRKKLRIPDAWQEEATGQGSVEEADFEGGDSVADAPMSFSEIQSAIQAAVNEKYPARVSPGGVVATSDSYVMEVYPDGTYIRRVTGSDNKAYRGRYELVGRKAQISDEVEVQPKMTYEEVRMSFEDGFELASFSGAGEGGEIVRRGKIFEAGEFPDKGFVLTPEEMRAAAAEFQGADLDVEHVPSVFSGKLGKLRRVWVGEDGKTLHGEAVFPSWMSNVIGKEPVRVSTTWGRKDKRIRGLALVLNPRITDATLTAAFNASQEQQGDNQPAGEAAVVNIADSDRPRRSGMSGTTNTNPLAALFSHIGAVLSNGGDPRLISQLGATNGSASEGQGGSEDGSTSQGGSSASGNATGASFSQGGQPQIVINNHQPAQPLQGELLQVDAPSAGTGSTTQQSGAAEFSQGGTGSGGDGGQQGGDEETPREKQLRLQMEAMQAQMAQMAKERLDRRAAEFADDMIRDERAFPAERASLVAAFKRAHADDEKIGGEVTFSRVGSDGKAEEVTGSRVEELEAMFKARPKHGQTQEAAGNGDVEAVANKVNSMAKKKRKVANLVSEDEEDLDGEELTEMDPERRRKLMAMTPLGRAQIKAEEEGTLPPFLKKKRKKGGDPAEDEED